MMKYFSVPILVTNLWTQKYYQILVEIKITSETQMKLIVYDEEKLRAKHDLVGDQLYFLNKVCSG